MKIIQGTLSSPSTCYDVNVNLGIRPVLVLLILSNPITIAGTYSGALPFGIAMLTDTPSSVGYASSSSVSYSTLGFLNNNGFTVRNSAGAILLALKYLAFIEED